MPNLSMSCAHPAPLVKPLTALRARGAGMQGKVDDINAQRRAIYKQRATAQGVSAGQVGRVYAQQIFNNSPAGTWFLGESGSWTRK